MELFLELIGWTGTAAFVVAYQRVSCGKMNPVGALYQWLNLGGAAAVGVSVFHKQAWPAFGLEAVWGGIALTSLFRLWKTKAG